MRCTLLISDLLLPSAVGGEPYQDMRLPLLETLLARASVALQPALGPEAWLCRAFGIVKQQDWPVAALTLRVDGVEPELHYWLRADPVELRVNRGQLMMAGRVADLDTDEAHALVAALNRHFGGDGITLLAPSPQRWYLRTEREPGLVTTPLARVTRHDIDRHLPRGDDALAWHRVINEAQMVLHAHAVNAVRETRGAATVNSIWLWGGGTAPAVARSPYSAVWSDDILARSLAAKAGIAHHDLPAGGAAWLATVPAEDGNPLLVFDQLAAALQSGDLAAWREQLALLERNWMNALLAALRTGKISAITLAACNSENLLEATLTRSQSWRFWRRARPLENYAIAV
jgi:hypothetical protein